MACPLTVWEDSLRGTRNELGFVARWVRGVLFYELPEWIFTTAYVAFAAVVVLTLLLIPPERRAKKKTGA